MQLEKYVRSILAEEEAPEISIPTLSEFDSDMMSEDNISLTSFEQDVSSLEFHNSKKETKPVRNQLKKVISKIPM